MSISSCSKMDGNRVATTGCLIRYFKSSMQHLINCTSDHNLYCRTVNIFMFTVKKNSKMSKISRNKISPNLWGGGVTEDHYD